MFHVDPKYIAAGLKVTPANGGIAKSIQLFAGALEGTVLSFSDDTLTENDRQAFPNVFHAPARSNIFCQRYGLPNRSELQILEENLTQLKLLSCHGMFGYHVHWVKKTSKEKNIPYWFIPHGQLDSYVFQTRRITKTVWWNSFGKSLVKNAAAVIFSSVEEFEKSRWLYRGNNTCIINWPISTPTFKANKTCKLRVRSELGIPAESNVAIYLGRLHTVKRPLQTIKALAAIQNKNWHLIVIGPPGDISLTDCKQYSEKFGLESRIHILGPKYHQEKFHFISAADFFISLSDRENFGHAAAECLSASVPCILSPGNALVREVAQDYPRAVIPLADNTVESATKALHRAALITPKDRSVMEEHAKSFVKINSITTFSKTVSSH